MLLSWSLFFLVYCITVRKDDRFLVSGVFFFSLFFLVQFNSAKSCEGYRCRYSNGLQVKLVFQIGDDFDLILDPNMEDSKMLFFFWMTRS